MFNFLLLKGNLA